MNKLWEDIVESLEGSCSSLIVVLDEFDSTDLEDHLPFLEYLDSKIFLCDKCGWWFPIGETSEEPFVCVECYDDEENY